MHRGVLRDLEKKMLVKTGWEKNICLPVVDDLVGNVIYWSEFKKKTVWWKLTFTWNCRRFKLDEEEEEEEEKAKLTHYDIVYRHVYSLRFAQNSKTDNI